MNIFGNLFAKMSFIYSLNDQNDFFFMQTVILTADFKQFVGGVFV